MNNFNSIVLIGPLGAGKDTVLAAIDEALRKAMISTVSWQVGWHYYRILAKKINKSVQYILANKSEFRTELQTLGTTPEYVNQAVEYTKYLHNKMIDVGVIPVVLGRLPDEALALQKLGAAVVFINSSEEERIERIKLRDDASPTLMQIRHEVEPTIDKFNPIADLIIDNDNKEGKIFCNYDDSLGQFWFYNSASSWTINLRCLI